MRIGVLAVQGNFREHIAALRRLGADAVEVRKPEQLEGLDGLVVPGGESTAIGRLVRLYGLEDAIHSFAGPIFGTCAGMILLAREAVDGVPGQPLLGEIDLAVRRNGYGRQVWSFEANVALAGDERPFRGVFIRAPRVEGGGRRGGRWREGGVRTTPSPPASPLLRRRRVSGHSKWSSIKHKKGAADARRGKLFSKLSRAIIVAAREGGADPDGNVALATAIQKARDNSMPKENIERAVARGAGAGAHSHAYETVTYEGYGPGGIAVYVEAL